METIAVHDGEFHSDDVFAVAILKLIYPRLKVIRTRDPKRWKETDARVDVGRNYNPKTGNFDHHQKEFTKKRDNGVPYASAGLIWDHFGKKLVNSDGAFSYIDELVIQPIDARDNGMDLYKEIGIIPYTINNVVDTFLPYWKDKNQDYDKSFEKAVKFAVKILEKELRLANGLKYEKEFIGELVSKSSKEYLVFENEFPNWKKILIKYPKIKYVIYKNPTGRWSSEAARVREGSFEVRKQFPREWADLTDEKLARVTGVEDAIFCHKGLFIAVARSKEGAIKLVELALEK